MFKNFDVAYIERVSLVIGYKQRSLYNKSVFFVVVVEYEMQPENM